jgi:hypothetical protein
MHFSFLPRYQCATRVADPLVSCPFLNPLDLQPYPSFQHALEIIDPVNPSNIIGPNSFAIADIKKLFKDAFTRLTDVSIDVKLTSAPTLLSRIIAFPHAMVTFRQHCEQFVEHSKKG